MSPRILKTFVGAVALLLSVAHVHEAAACSPPTSVYQVTNDIPPEIPMQGALPVVFSGSDRSVVPPLDDPMVSFVVQNSNDKIIPGDAELYLIDRDSGNLWSFLDYLVAWSPTDGWTPDETYTLKVTTGSPSDAIEHTFTAIDAGGDLAAPIIDAATMNVLEQRAASDCCVPDEDVYNTCTGEPERRCWTTDFVYTPQMQMSLASVEDDIWASQTLLTLESDNNMPFARASTDAQTVFRRQFSMQDSSYCLRPATVRIADGSRIAGEQRCLGPEDLPNYDERDATEVVAVPDECDDTTGGDAEPDAGEMDSGAKPDSGDDAETYAPDGSASDAGSGNDTEPGASSSGCGCSSRPNGAPVSAFILLIVGLAALRLRRVRRI